MTYPPPPPAYGPPAAAPGGKQRLRGRTPRTLGWVFLALGIIGIVVGAVLAGVKSLGAVDDFQRVTVSQGSGTITVDRTGRWVGYYEASDVSTSTDRIPVIRAQITGPDGRSVDFDPYGNRSDGKIRKFTYAYQGHHGIAAIQFDAPSKGTYKIQLQPGETVPSGADIAFGKDLINSGLVAGGILVIVGILLLIAAIVLLIVGFVKRGRHKRELASGYGGYGGPGGFGGYPQDGGYPQGGYPPPPVTQ